MHELVHALGRWHEQSRPDRDQHIRVNKDNIREGEAIVSRMSWEDLRSPGSLGNCSFCINFIKSSRIPYFLGKGCPSIAV